MCPKVDDILYIERFLKGSKEGKMDEVTCCIDNGIDIECENEVSFIDSCNQNMRYFV